MVLLHGTHPSAILPRQRDKGLIPLHATPRISPGRGFDMFRPGELRFVVQNEARRLKGKEGIKLKPYGWMIIITYHPPAPPA